MSGPVRFSLTLQHLARDARAAGAELPPIELQEVAAEQLRGLLEAMVALAPTVAYPAQPEMRIVSPHGRFLVQVRDGRTRFSSWSLRGSNREFTSDEIFAAITGLEREAEESEGRAGPPVAAHAMPSARVLKIVALGLAIAGTNAFTAWMVTRPPPDLMPAYRLIADEPAKRVLADAAGGWATGTRPGDRALQISERGEVRWTRLGEDGQVAETTQLTVQPAEVAGKTALVTSTRAVIELRDAITVVFYGDTYRRRMP